MTEYGDIKGHEGHGKREDELGMMGLVVQGREMNLWKWVWRINEGDLSCEK